MRGCSSHTQRAPHLRPHGLVWCTLLPALMFVGELKFYLSNSFRTSQTEFEGSQLQRVDFNGFNIPRFLLYPVDTPVLMFVIPLSDYPLLDPFLYPRDMYRLNTLVRAERRRLESERLTSTQIILEGLEDGDEGDLCVEHRMSAPKE